MNKVSAILVLALIIVSFSCASSGRTQAVGPSDQQVSFKAEKISSLGGFSSRYNLYVFTINGEKIPCIYVGEGYGGGCSCDWAKQSDFAKSLNQR